MTTNTPPLRILIDATNMVAKDAFGVPGPERAPELAMARLCAIEKHWKPERILAAFDAPGETFRHRLHPAYKAGRSPKPDGFDDAIEAVQGVCFDRAIDVVTVAGWEADDCIATLARIATEKGRRVLIYSADRDLHQLLRDGEVTQLTALKRNRSELQPTFLTAQMLRNRERICPQQWVDYRAMVGDKSDNIAGIPGVGEVAAKTILAKRDTLDQYIDDIRAHRDADVDVSPSQRAKIANAAKTILPRLRRLLTLDDHTPLTPGWQT